jgi:hypothetical protein
MVYTFNNGICSIPYDIRNNSPAPSAFTYQFDTTSQVICTIEMMVYAFAEGYSDYAIRSATTKRIIFADVPNISNFNIRPEWRWDGSDWEQVVESKQTNSGTILVASPTLSAYGLCHTENFFLSTSEAGEQYIWSMQDINYPELQEQTITTAPTAWISFKTGPNSSYISICASVFSGLISSTMPVLYYDTPQGTRFTNFATTYDSTTSDLKQHIKIIGIQDLSLHIELTGTNQLQYPVPNYYYLSGIYTALDNTSLFDEYVSVYYFNLSSVFWNDQVRSNNISNNLATASVYLNEDNIGESRFGVPSNEITKINITPEIEYALQLKKNHPSANDWCFSSITDINSSSSITITAYPMTPSIYTSNRFILTGVNIQYQNMVQCFSGVDELNWNDRDNILTVNTCIPYTTSYDSVGNYDLGLTNTYRINGLTGTLVSEFKDIVNISNQYISYDPEISRVFGKTKLSFPYTLDNCKMPPNEWVTEDTFNSVINKLYSNLEYLENMSKLYDIPPTSYIGWYGTIYYNNSTMRTRWFTNTPHNSYKYDHPEIAIDGMFNNLQSCFVRDNIMYLSNGTTVYILSSDFWGTEISLRDYKTLGDDFTNIKAISLDSQGRIYLLDTSNQYYSSKNRVIVYSYNAISDQWQLMYEWGGLGGLNAKNKFNSPNDLFIDDSDNVWVADTFNKCIKKYTRTGSWLKTITSEYFTETEQPLSVITNAEYIYVLTNSQIVCFNSNGMYVDKYNIATGAKRICKCRDGGFLYILYTNEIVKYTLTGIEAGVIEPTNFVSYTADFRCVFHDEYRNLYIINKNHILKYVDQLSITNLKTDTFDQGWPLEKLHVHKDEYIQDWIINRCFQRLWDNIEIFRRSLNGKFGYQTFQSTTLMSFITTIQPPDNFDYCKYDWLYDQGIAVEQNVTFEYQKPVVRTFNIDEFRDLPYEKNMICIGINELHSSDVYNRVITKLFECENTILQMIDD